MTGFYWTWADTFSAIIAGGGGLLGVHLVQAAQRLLRRQTG